MMRDKTELAFLKIFLLINLLIMHMPACQKKAPDLITDGCEPLCGCWGLNSGPLKEQLVLLTSEPSLQPQN